MSTTDTSLHIAAVERDTGIPKDTLRVWERRYGFPQPARNDHGERTYPMEQVSTLRLVKQLVDAGYRPNRVVGRDPSELHALLEQSDSSTPPATLPPEAHEVIEGLRRHSLASIQEKLRAQLMRHGLERFVIETVAPLTTAIGESWAKGKLAIHEEHLYSELVDRVLVQAVGQQPALAGRPPVVLATLPGELHRLGLRMVEALFAARGRPCVSIGPDVPIDQIVAAHERHAADTVALSISACGATPTAARAVLDLRAQLPSETALWLGGTGAARLRPRPQGQIVVFETLTDLVNRLAP